MTLGEFDRLPSFERDLWLAEWQERRKPTCPDCGGPIERCADPDRVWYPGRRICYVSRETAAAVALYDALHEKRPYHDGTYQSWSEARTASHPYRYDDGVRVSVAEEDLAPWDEFTTEVNASPVESVAEQSPGEQSEADDETAPERNDRDEQSDDAEDFRQPSAQVGLEQDQAEQEPHRGDHE